MKHRSYTCFHIQYNTTGTLYSFLAPEAWDREILEKIIKEEIAKISERLEGYADIMRKAKVF